MRASVTAIVVLAAAVSAAKAEERPSISYWLNEGYEIVEIVNAGDRERGLREIYLRKGDKLLVCHLSTEKTVVGGEGVDIRDCFIVDV